MTRPHSLELSIDEAEPRTRAASSHDTAAVAPGVAPPITGPDFLRKFFDFSRIPVAYDWRIEPGQRVYVNRNLRMDEIAGIGFDMDYTLAIYLKRQIEELAFNVALNKLVCDWGYPEAVRQVAYDPDGVIRGLVVDRKLGNVLKMDQYKVVTQVHHGKRALGPIERRELYFNRKIRLGQERYFSIDTLFGLPEGSLYQELVEFADTHPDVLPPDYARLYDDVRSALDRAHRDNSMKGLLLEDPARYVFRDPKLPATLEKFLKGGKKLFIVTNSEWWYTDAVMSFLLDAQLDYLPRWTDYFEIVVVEAAKPLFFLGDRTLEPVPGTPPGPSGAPKVFAKGNVVEFEKLLGMRTDAVLFIGDHIYGDILRSKKHSGWRTVMIIEEIEAEILSGKGARRIVTELARLQRKIEGRDFKRNLLQMKISFMEQLMASDGASRVIGSELGRQKQILRQLDERIAAMHAEHSKLEAALEERYNRNWGPLFRAGSEISRFGQQVQDYACLYTGRVSNFLAYPFNKFFQSPREVMPHDL